MKKFKKILALAVAAVMLLGLGTVVSAAEVDSGKGGNASITITLPTDETAPTKVTTYKIYKVFDATSDGESDAISYTSRQGETMPAGFVLDAAGNVHHGTKAADGTITENTATALTAEEIAAIAAYVRATDLVYTAEVAVGETSVTITGLEYGYYYITTSTGSIVTVDSTNPDAEVNDKNIIPIVKKSAGTQYDKESLKAIAAVGTDQPFTAQVNVGKGTINLVFTDTMTNMTYNGDVKVTVGGSEVASSTTVNTDAANETFTITGAQGDATFTLTFDNDYIAGLAASTVITINYSGKITSDALSVNPAKNKATITSGDGNTNTSEEVEVYNAKFTVTKQDDKEKPLAGAGFVIKNSEGAYYKLNAATDTAPASITWYALTSGETLAQAIAAGKVTEYKSDAQGAVPAFTGLKDGTYTLVESTTPAGYNTVADSEFTIAADDYTTDNLEQSTTVINNAGAVLPSTGGMGTTILYIVGGVVVAAALVLLITKRRMRREEY